MIKFMIAYKLRILIFFICIVLFIVPFFWLKPGEMDLGGDSNRLYFYDPLSNLKSFAIFSVVPWGIAHLSYNQYFIPYLLFLSVLKFIFGSPTVLIAIFNGAKLSGSFIFVFLIIKQFLFTERHEEMTIGKWCGAVIGGLFYVFSPAILENMKYALVTHDLVFLNPLIFYLLLKALIKSSMRYLWLALLISLIFSSSFSLQAPPPLFAFYPLAIIFLFLYNFLVLRKSIPWKGIIFGILFFLGLQAFHLIPVASNIFDKGSAFNERVFEATSKVNAGLEGFNALLSAGKVGEHILLPLADQKLSLSLIIIPSLTMLGFSFAKKNKTLLLLGIFFLITLFLVSANITQIGVEFYRKLFYIPGFGMFRIFYGQWQWVFTFFYAIMAGLAISYLFSRMKKKYIFITSIAAIGLLIARSWIVFDGKIINVVHRGTKDLGVIVRMDPKYEQMLEFIKNLPNDGRIIHMPFTDYGYNIVGGINRGVYIGQSIPSFLAGRNDFSGYQDIAPFSESYVKLVKEKNYSLIKQMMSLLQVRYVLYNSDEKVSDRFFTSFLYGYTGTPASQSALLDFVQNISGEKVHEEGSYSLFEVEKEYYLPHFYIPEDIFLYNADPKYAQKYNSALSFFPQSSQEENVNNKIAFVDRKDCNKILANKICNQNKLFNEAKDVQIIYKRINPTKYKLSIKNVKKPFLLVFQNSFSPHWKLFPTNSPIASGNIGDSYFDGGVTELMPVSYIFDKNPFETNKMRSAHENTHIKVNGYANAWYIRPNELSGNSNHELILEMITQKTVYYSFIVSTISLLAFLLYGVKLLIRQKL